MLIELSEGILVEVEDPNNRGQLISNSLSKNKVQSSFSDVAVLLSDLINNLSCSLKDTARSNQIDKYEVCLKLGFEAQGNLFVAKSKATANLDVKIIIDPRYEKSS